MLGERWQGGGFDFYLHGLRRGSELRIGFQAVARFLAYVGELDEAFDRGFLKHLALVGFPRGVVALGDMGLPGVAAVADIFYVGASQPFPRVRAVLVSDDRIRADGLATFSLGVLLMDQVAVQAFCDFECVVLVNDLRVDVGDILIFANQADEPLVIRLEGAFGALGFAVVARYEVAVAPIGSDAHLSGGDHGSEERALVALGELGVPVYLGAHNRCELTGRVVAR